ncbi:MAG: BrnT family toxin [Candidatus Hydrogenedentes bacterium]|nr:BrnT family toxin [Candidatus Hydrogenedentota bacterium]
MARSGDRPQRKSSRFYIRQFPRADNSDSVVAISNTCSVDSSVNEDRYILVGTSARSQLLIIAYTDRGDRIRIISARKMTRAERRAYENEIKKRKG